MKKFLVVLIVILLGFLSYIAYYYLTKTEKEVLILVPQKRYSFYYDEDQIMNIPIFTNNQNIINSFSDIASISNLDNSIKLMLDNISINYLYNYLHEDEVLSHYELSFHLPDLQSTYEIEELYLNIEINLTLYSIYLGSIRVLYDEEYYSDFFEWDYVQANKNEGAHISELIIGYSNHLRVDNILIDNIKHDFEIKNNEIIVEIISHDYIFDQTFVIFEYQNQKQIIKNFKFFYHYDLLNNIRYRTYLIT